MVMACTSREVSLREYCVEESEHLEGMQVLAEGTPVRGLGVDWHSVVPREQSLRVARSLEAPAQERGASLETLPA